MKLEMDYRYSFFYGLLILGCVIQGFAKPASENSSTTVEDEMEMQNDYNDQNEYSDDDTGSVPDSPPTPPTQKAEPTEPPYFEQKEYTKQAKPGNDIVLECLARNLGPSNVILWYKEDKVIVAGSKPVGDRYRFDETNHNLSIVNATEKDSGNYYCEVQPQKIRLHANVEISELSNYAEAQSDSNAIRSTFILPTTTCLVLLTSLLRI